MNYWEKVNRSLLIMIIDRYAGQSYVKFPVICLEPFSVINFFRNHLSFDLHSKWDFAIAQNKTCLQRL